MNDDKPITIDAVDAMAQPRLVFDALQFASYCANRDERMTPEQWARHFPATDVEDFERRYQLRRACRSA